jgi:soluble lytic murein transglycosylase-like protein
LALVLAVLLTVAALIFSGKASGADCPDWALRGIMAAETSSHFRADGSINYVNRNRGRAGEVGITQAMPATLRLHGFSPSFFEQDRAYAIRATRVILGRYFDRTGSWLDAVAMWHRPNDFRSPKAQRYVERVLAAGR